LQTVEIGDPVRVGFVGPVVEGLLSACFCSGVSISDDGLIPVPVA
jgi:hypothetical protein